MTIGRLALRALTVRALTKQPYDKHPPTIAKDLVFDSRVDPINIEEDIVEVPIIAVYTDTDFASLVDQGAGKGTIDRKVDLRIDFAIASFMRTVVDDETNISYGVPTTDAELETMLDIFEAQIWRALLAPGRAASDAWSKMVRKVESWASRVDRSGEGNNRLASRSLELRCVIRQDCGPQFRLDIDPEQCIDIHHLTHKLPWAQHMLDVFADDPAYQSVKDVLVDAAGGASIVLPALKDFGFGYHSTLTPENAVLTALANGKPLPRGTIHVKQNWSLK